MERCLSCGILKRGTVESIKIYSVSSKFPAQAIMTGDIYLLTGWKDSHFFQLNLFS